MVHGYPDIGLIREDLLSAIPKDVVAASLVVGRLVGDDGKPIPNWYSFYSPHRVVVRGSSHAAVRYCPLCSRPIYFAKGKHYLCPPPRTDVSLFHSDWGRLVVDEHVVQAVASVTERRLRVKEVPVCSEPKDGLAQDVSLRPN
jgi:hypothetical protein